MNPTYYTWNVLDPGIEIVPRRLARIMLGSTVKAWRMLNQKAWRQARA